MLHPRPAVGRPGPPGAKRQAQRLVSPSEGNEARREGRRASEHLIVPWKQGNGNRPDPGEGRGCLVAEPLGGNRSRALYLAGLSTKRQRIAQRFAKPRRDEPDALIGHVRICGSLGE